jgi:hypothetical protein
VYPESPKIKTPIPSGGVTVSRSELKNHADIDGMVHCAAAHISIDLEQPLRTVQGALQRLEQQGEVYFIERGKFIVVAMASVDEIDAD